MTDLHGASGLRIDVAGSPTEDEVAAIVAAIELSWPKPVPAATDRIAPSTRWRYSGRWWQDGRLPPRWS